MTHTSFLRSAIPMFIGPIIWVVHFLLIYGLTGIVCARPAMQQDWLGISILGWGIGVATAAAIGCILAVQIRNWQAQGSLSNGGFIAWIASSLAMLSIVAIAWEALPVLFVSSCN